MSPTSVTLPEVVVMLLLSTSRPMPVAAVLAKFD